MKTAAFITCRLASTRLPRKHLLEVNGRYIVEILIDRVKQARNIDEIYVCTTTNDEDRQLVDVAVKNGIKYFCGDEDDIIKRHYDCALENGIELIVNIDGDDILIDFEYIDKITDEFKKNGCFDVVKTVGLPFGMNSMAYKIDVLAKILELKENEASDTGWGIYFSDARHFNVLEIQAAKNHSMDEIRATLDYEDDYKFFKAVIEEMAQNKTQYNTEDIIALIKQKPFIAGINNHLNEEYWANFNKKKVKLLEA